MKKLKFLCSLSLSVLLLSGLAPSVSATSLDFDKAPTYEATASNYANLQKPIKAQVRKDKNHKAVVENEAANPLYPAKYTPKYIESIQDTYKVVGKDEIFYVALDLLKDTNGEFSRKAILGNNLTGRPVKIEFKDLSTISPAYSNFDALGWKKKSRLYIYINQKHSNAPAIAIAALLSHEALHQDEYNSLSEETYAWTMEAAVWCELLKLHPDYNLPVQSLVTRENTLKKLFEKGDYTNKYIKKSVYSNSGYQNLPETSPGFENL
jgi:hypothetical protein